MSENQVRERKDIQEKYQWDLGSLYASDEKWEEDFTELKKLSEQITKYKGRTVESSNTLLNVIELSNDIKRKSENIFTYAKMKLDEDTREDKYQSYSDRAKSLMVEAEEKLSFIVPEILTIDESKLNSYIEGESGLKQYKHSLEKIIRKREHTLSPQEEAIIAQSGDLADAPQNTFSMLNNADIKFPEITNENGEQVEITHGRFIPLLMSSNRRVRKDAFKGLYDTYKNYKNTFAATLSGDVKNNIFYSKVRKYNSAMEASLDNNKIPVDVYDNLINAVHKNLDSMHRYVKLRKKALGLDELHMYDLYTPIVKDIDLKFNIEQGQDLVLKGLQALGEDYVSTVNRGLNSNWIDVYENKGKRSGAYSWGTYDSEPFILLNYQDTLDDVFTLAHELGHSMHSLLTRDNQPYVYGSYSIFVAEVASTVNEALLMDYMLKNTNKEEERLYLLNHYLEQFRGTVYRQTMFAEFEKMIHAEVEKGESLTAEKLSSMYKGLNEKYYGKDIIVDDEIAMEWARIPHFYYNFYVFQYATGFSAAVALAQKILDKEEGALDKYLEFLKSGNSDYPINVLNKAGVDMTSPEPVDKALKLFGKLVDEMEKLLG